MSFSYGCPNCGKKYKVPEAVEGKRTKCRKCGAVMIPSRQVAATVPAGAAGADYELAGGSSKMAAEERPATVAAPVPVEMDTDPSPVRGGSGSKAFFRQPKVLVMVVVTLIAAVAAAINPPAAMLLAYVYFGVGLVFISFALHFALDAGAHNSDTYNSVRYLPYIRLPFYFFHGLVGLFSNAEVYRPFVRRSRYAVWLVVLGALLYARGNAYMRDDEPVAMRRSTGTPGPMASPEGVSPVESPEVVAPVKTARPAEEPLSPALLRQYELDAPPSFTADSTVLAGSRRWTHTAPGRSVVSELLISVRPAGSVALKEDAKSVTRDVNGLHFVRGGMLMTPDIWSTEWRAIDGGALIDVKTVMDVRDRPSMQELNGDFATIRRKAGP